MENKNVIRFEFTKKAGLKYISHLDLQRAVVRIIKKSGIPVRYTQGFNPHPKMVFALTLGVGCESECELLDVYMVMDEARPNVPLYTPEQFKQAILPNLPKGLEFVDAYYPELPFSSIKSATYAIEIDLVSDEDLKEYIESVFRSPMIVYKRSKAGDRDVDISPMVIHYSYEQKGSTLKLDLVLKAEQNNYLSPELVMTALKKNSVLNSAFDFYTVTRKKINFEN